MPRKKSFSEKTTEELNKFGEEVTLVIVGLFLAVGVQSLIQFIVALYPHITPYFYLGLGIVSLILVMTFLNLAAKYSGVVDKVKQEMQDQSTKA